MEQCEILKTNNKCVFAGLKNKTTGREKGEDKIWAELKLGEKHKRKRGEGVKMRSQTNDVRDHGDF